MTSLLAFLSSGPQLGAGLSEPSRTAYTRSLHPSRSALSFASRTASCSLERPKDSRRPSSRDDTWSEVLSSRPVAELRVGGIAVPRHLWSGDLRRRGVFRSVEYRVLRLQLDGEDILSTLDVQAGSVADVVATIRPLRRLLPSFETSSSWPVSVAVGHARLWSYKRDIAQCFAVTVTTAVCTLLFGVYAPNLFSFYFIPSLSMYPTFDVGDAVLVDKSEPTRSNVERGDVVFFSGPSRLLHMIQDYHPDDTTPSGQTPHSGADVAKRSLPAPVHRKDLFVKRVAGIPGDVVSISHGAIYVNGACISSAANGSMDCEEQKVPEHFLYVLGDDPPHSLDSRYWGLLNRDLVVGKPVLRVWPLSRLSRL